MTKPPKFTASGKEAKLLKALNVMSKAIEERTPISAPGALVTKTSCGFSIKPMLKPVSGGGLRFASPKLYDSTTSYDVDEIVIVATSTNTQTAGVWVCVKKPSEDNLPKWPPVGLTEASALANPDNENIYWWPLTQFCT